MSKIDSKAMNRPQHLTLLKEVKPKMSILSHYHGHGNTRAQRRAPRATRACAELALSRAHPQAPSVSLGSSSSIPSQPGTALSWWSFTRNKGEPLWLGLLQIGAWHLPFPQVLAQGAPAELPLLHGWHRAPPARLCPLDTPRLGARGGCQGCSHRKELHIAKTLISRQIYQVQTPTVISYSSQVRAVKEIKTFM